MPPVVPIIDKEMNGTMKTCPSCGAQNRDDSSACCNCYSPMDSGGTAKGSYKPAPRQINVERPKSATARKSGDGGGGKLLSFLLVVILLAGAAYGAYWYFLRPTPEKAIKQMAAALKNEDLDATLGFLSSDTIAFLDSTGLPGLLRDAQQKAGKKPKTGEEDFSVKIDSCTYTDPDHADVAVTTTIKLPSMPMSPMLQPGQSRNQQLTVPMLREEGKWKVDGMKAIDTAMRSIPDQQMKIFGQVMKFADNSKGMIAAQQPGLNLDPVSKLVYTELKRRNINPASIKPFDPASFMQQMPK